MPEELIYGGALLIGALLLIWAWFWVARRRRRKIQRSERPIRIKIREE